MIRGVLAEIGILLIGFFTSLLPGFGFNPEDAAAFAVGQNMVAQEGPQQQAQGAVAAAGGPAAPGAAAAADGAAAAEGGAQGGGRREGENEEGGAEDGQHAHQE